MGTKGTIKQLRKRRSNGSVLALVALAIFVLTIFGLGVLTIAYGARLRAVAVRNETIAKLTAEAGYESAIYWMSQRDDVLGDLVPVAGGAGRRGSGGQIVVETGSGEFDNGHTIKSNFEYSISFDRFEGTYPVYKIVADGHCRNSSGGTWVYNSRAEAHVVQAIYGWNIGLCERPHNDWKTTKVYFTSDDVIEMPLRINCKGELHHDNEIDIHIDTKNKPVFSQQISMGESRYKDWGRNTDKYRKVIDLFNGGIYFDQPDTKIENPSTLRTKVKRFELNTDLAFNFSRRTRREHNSVIELPGGSMKEAVQVEFYVEGNIGKVKITDNCAVRCVTGGKYDYKLAIDELHPYEKYDIYGYHYAGNNYYYNDRIEGTYVQQRAITPSGAIEKTPLGGRVYVDGNVVIGGEVRSDGVGGWEINTKDRDGNDKWFPNKLKGKITVVATGNIWIVSPIEYDGPQVEVYDNGVLVKKVPASKNPNVLGLFSRDGVVKVIDPGQSLSIPTQGGVPADHIAPTGEALPYRPVGYVIGSKWQRSLPATMVIQAAITVGGGGWGAESVDDRATSGPGGKDNLVLAGSITEAVRGLVKDPGKKGKGFKKYYYFDQRLRDGISQDNKGILPGNMWLQSKFIAVPGGWRDLRI